MSNPFNALSGVTVNVGDVLSWGSVVIASASLLVAPMPIPDPVKHPWLSKARKVLSIAAVAVGYATHQGYVVLSKQQTAVASDISVAAPVIDQTIANAIKPTTVAAAVALAPVPAVEVPKT